MFNDWKWAWHELFHQHRWENAEKGSFATKYCPGCRTYK